MLCMQNSLQNSMSSHFLPTRVEGEFILKSCLYEYIFAIEESVDGSSTPKHTKTCKCDEGVDPLRKHW